MNQKQSIGLGTRGWLLLIYQFLAFIVFMVFTNYPMNILATSLSDVYGDAQTISMIYTVSMLVGMAIQLVLSQFIGKVKSVKWLSHIFGIITLAGALGVSVIPGGVAWTICYIITCVFCGLYGMFSLGILVGQWFPRRKGTVMGIATLAFPIGNGLIGVFAGALFSKGYPDVTGAFMPFWIAGLIGLIIGVIFVTDYPEQCGAFRDNDRSFTPEMAKAMMLEEIENKKTSVWKIGATLKSAQFWLITLPMGALLMCSVGMMAQTNAIIGAYPDLPFAGVMAAVMVFACLGSYLLGLLDTKLGTRKAVIIASAIMALSGVFGAIGGTIPTAVSIVLLAVFMGAGSNFTVSAAAQYWRREDFPSVFGVVNPVANILQCAGPIMVAATIGMMPMNRMPFILTGVIGLVSVALSVAFSPAKVKETDDQLRKAAGKPLDEVLAGRR